MPTDNEIETTCGCNGCNSSYVIEPPQYDHVVVDTYSELVLLRNVYATVRQENATYHVDGYGAAVSVSRDPIFINDYTPTVGEYKQNTVYDFENNKAYIFNLLGAYKSINLS